MDESNEGEQQQRLTSGRVWPPASEDFYGSGGGSSWSDGTQGPPPDAGDGSVGAGAGSVEAGDASGNAGAIDHDAPLEADSTDQTGQDAGAWGDLPAEEATEERVVRCSRCHYVFNPSEGKCSRCGHPYTPPSAYAAPADETYAQRYRGTEFAEPVENTAPPPSVDKMRQRPLILAGIGAVMLILALVFVLVYQAGSSNTNGDDDYVVAGPTKASPTPTLVPVIAEAYRELADKDLSAHVVVHSRADLDARITGQAKAITVNFEGDMAGGNESGTVTTNGSSQEFRLVDGTYFVKGGDGKWSAAGSIPSYLILSPLLNVTKGSDLVVVGQETKDGQPAIHLRSSPMWRPDSRTALCDLSSMPIAPDDITLDVWTTPEGRLISAAYTGLNTTRDGKNTRLLDVETSYAFTNVGFPLAIGTPEPPPTPAK